MSTTLERRALVQKEGIRRVRAEMFEMLAEAISSGECNPDIATVALIDRIVDRTVRTGIEIEADAVQPEFTAMSLRIVELEEQLSGIPSPSLADLFQRQQEALKS